MSPTVDQSADLHRNDLNAIRLLLAVSVIFSHSYPLLRGPQSADPRTHDFLFRLTLGQFDFAYWAVDCFFILSGFLIVASWERSDGALDYLVRRCLRIYPCFVVTSILCAIVVGPTFPAHRDSFFADLDVWPFVRGVLTLLPPVLPPVFPDNPMHTIAGSLWTIQYEFGCYLMILVLGACCGRRLGIALTALTLLCAVAFHQQLGGRFAFAHTDYVVFGDVWHWPRFATCFLAGSLYWVHRARIRYTLSGALSVTVALAIATFLRQLGWIFPLLGGYVIFAVGLHAGLGLWRVTRRQDWSYGTYCFAYPIQQCLVALGGERLTPLSLFALALPITLAVAAVSWNVVEHPALELKKRFGSAQRRLRARAAPSAA